MIKTFTACAILFFTIAQSLQAQSSLLQFEENIEQLAIENESGNWDDELEQLQRRYQDPLNINEATKSQLEEFPFLSSLQIEKILSYLYSQGEMQTVYELGTIDYMDKHTIDLLLPFITVRPSKSKKNYPAIKDIAKYGKHELLTRIDIPLYKKKGYESNYLGTPQYHSLRYLFSYGDYLQVGILGEKDYGEPLFAGKNKNGYDFYSLYFVVKGLGHLKTLALGNYKLSFGQGLVLNSSFSMGKSFSLSSSEYRASKIRKHSSTDEYNYFSGVATTLNICKGLDFSGFFSQRNMDGITKNGTITSITKTGYHRTETELSRRRVIKMTMYGGNISFERNLYIIGVTGIYYGFNKEYVPRLTGYKKYNMTGKSFANGSVDYLLRLGKMRMAGEAAIGTSGYAIINRLTYDFSTDYKMMLIHRFYSHDYWSFYGRSFGESSTPQNENGWYLASELSPIARWRFFASVDIFSTPWWRYRISKPSQGIDVMFQSTYSLSNNISMLFNYRFKRKERDVTGTSGKEILPTAQHRFRYRVMYSSTNLTARLTADLNTFRQKETSKGFQITQLISYSPNHIPLTASLQGTYFNTDSYDSRVYVYEKGLLNTFYTPSFNGEGFRYSAQFRFDAGKTLMIIAKIGQTKYLDRKTIGTGNDLINSSSKTDVQLQLRLKL